MPKYGGQPASWWITERNKGTFWKHANRKEGECWLWGGTLTHQGYGCMQLSKEGFVRQLGAHRYSYALLVGPIPAGAFILHSCHVKRCVNPAHIRAGSPADNSRDMVEAGRQAFNRGEKHGLARVTADAVREIRRLYREDGVRQRDLARGFGLTQASISRIIRRHRWKHI